MLIGIPMGTILLILTTAILIRLIRSKPLQPTVPDITVIEPDSAEP
jgi:hypothetical protein